jgi:hypothetical protein
MPTSVSECRLLNRTTLLDLCPWFDASGIRLLQHDLYQAAS